MLNVILIGSDTQHRKFIVNRLIDSGHHITSCIFAKSNVKPKFNVNSPWALEEEKELPKLYCKSTRNDLDRVSTVRHIEALTMDDPVVRNSIVDADFVIVSGADRISGNVLNAIKNKALNVHMGIAEKYRGLDSNLWAWYHSDYKNIGVTLHKLETSLDTGDLFQVGRITVNDNTKVWKLRYQESVLAAKLISKILYKLTTNKVKLRTQNSVGRYYSFMPFEIKKCLSITPNRTKL